MSTIGRLLGWRGWGQILKVGVSAVAVWLLVRQIDPAEFATVLGKARTGPVLIAITMYLAGQVASSYRWKIISNSVGFPYGLSTMTRYYFIGMFFNLFGPSTLGGDVVRALYLAQSDRRRAVAANTVLFDRASGLAMLVLVAVAAMACWGDFGLPMPLVWLTVLVGTGMIAGWWVLPFFVRSLFPPGNRIRRLVEEEIGPFWRDVGLLLRASAVSLCFHVLQVITLIILGKSLSLTVPWRYYFVFHPLVTVLSALPISLAGLGVREMGYLWFLERYRVPHELGVAFGLLWLVVLLVSSAVGGLVFLAGGAELPRVAARAEGILSDQPSASHSPRSS